MTIFKIKITPLNAVTALTALYLVNSYVIPKDAVRTEKGRVVHVDTQVDKASMRDASEELVRLLNKSDKKVLIKVTSPGGSVLDGRDFINKMKQADAQIDTYADNYFMSMGMAIFLEGKERIITDDALGMIHRGSVGGVSYATLVKKRDALREFLSKPEVATKKARTDYLLSAPPVPPKAVTKEDLETQLEELNSAIEIMDKLFEREFILLEQVKKTAPKPEFTQKIIDSMKKGDRDVFLSAQELIDSGIATKVVKKISNEYK